jgi:hypothetical protein
MRTSATRSQDPQLAESAERAGHTNHPLADIQRTAGNRAVQRLLQSSAQAGVPVQQVAAGTGVPVVQRETIGSVEIIRDAMGGYATWEHSGGTWHLNTKLGGVIKGKQVYHVTREDVNPKAHYFFTLSAGTITDSAPGGKSQKGAKKFSKLPTPVQDFVRTNINALLPK